MSERPRQELNYNISSSSAKVLTLRENSSTGQVVLISHAWCSNPRENLECKNEQFHEFQILLTTKAENININSYSASRGNWCTVGGDGGCRVG